MSTNRAFIDNNLKHRAYDIAYSVCRHWPVRPGQGNDFAGFDWGSSAPSWRVVNNGIEFSFGNNAKISFLNIRPAMLKSISFGEAQRRNERADSSDTLSIFNHSSAEVTRELTVAKSNEVTTASSETIGVAVTTSLRQQVKYGGAAYGVEGETEFSLEVQTAWERTVEKSSTSSSSKEEVLEIVVPPRKRIEITKNTSIADTLQPLTVVAEIDYDILIQDANDYFMLFKSIGELEKFISGLFPAGYKEDRPGSNQYRAGDYYADGNHTNFRVRRSTTTLTKNIEYQGATAGDVIVREFDLSESSE